MPNEKHNNRKVKEYISELLYSDNLFVQDGIVTRTGNDITIEKGIIRPLKIENNGLRFSTVDIFDYPSDDTIIWRYMDWKKFEYLVKEQKLYMSSPIKFSQDAKEGFPTKDIEYFIKSTIENVYYQHIKPKYKDILVGNIKLTGRHYRDLPILTNIWKKIYKFCRPRFYISCWTERDYESEQMWKSYIEELGARKTAVAIKTTVGDFKKSIKSTGLFDLARVQYFDSKTLLRKTKEEYYRILQGVYPLVRYMLLNKRDCFIDDKEIRLMTDNLIQNRTQWEKNSILSFCGDSDFDYEQPLEFEAMKIPIDLQTLIKEIRISPWADSNFIDKVKELLEFQNIKGVQIEKSRLFIDEIYVDL